MGKPKCVCIFSNFFPPVVSGSSVQVGKLCSELVRKGWTVVVICARTVSGSSDYEVVEGVHVYRMPSLVIPKALTLGFNFSWLGITFKPANIKRVKAIIKNYQPSIIHLHNYMFDLSLSAVLLSHLYKLPMVLTVHTFLRHPSPLINVLFYLAEQLILKWLVVRRAKCVICPDMNVVNYARREFGKVPTEMIPYGIHLSDSQVDAKKILEKKFDLKGKRLILSVGHLHAMRNREDLFLAMPLILEEVPNAVLMIVGDVSVPIPDEVLDCEDTENGVIFAGSLDHTEVSALLGFAELEAHWLNLYEPERTSLGIASLEAMSAALPVLTTANPAIFGEGVLNHEDNIIIVEPHNPEKLAKTIVNLLNNDSRRKSIGINAQKTIMDHFSWDIIVEQTVEVYESILNH